MPARARQRTALTGAGLIVLCLVTVAALALALGGTPRTASADGGAPNLAYVVGGGADRAQLVVVDVARRQVTGHVELGGDPRAVVLSLDGRFAYVPRAGHNDVAVVDTRALRVVESISVGRQPVALAADITTSGNIFVADAGSNAVSVLDLPSRRVVATIPVGQQPVAVAAAGAGSGIADPTDTEIYVANRGSDTLSVISAKRRAVTATIPLPGGPASLVVPNANGVLYVGTESGAVLAVSLADHRVLGTLLQLHGSAAGQMDYDALTGAVYVPDAAAGVVDVLRPASAGAGGGAHLPTEPERTLPFAGSPMAVAITFDGAYGFVAAQQSGQLVQFDAVTRATLATIAIGGAPRALVTGPYPPAPAQQPASAANAAPYVIFGLILLGVVAVALGRGPLRRWWMKRSGGAR